MRLGYPGERSRLGRSPARIATSPSRLGHAGRLRAPFGRLVPYVRRRDAWPLKSLLAVSALGLLLAALAVPLLLADDDAPPVPKPDGDQESAVSTAPSVDSPPSPPVAKKMPTADSPALPEVIVRRDVETRSVVVDEQRVQHAHPIRVELAALLAALLLLPTAGGIAGAWRLKKSAAGALRMATAATAIALALSAFSVDHEPEPPVAAPAKAPGLPRMVPVGTERQRSGDSIIVTKKFRRDVATRRLTHVHAYSLTALADQLLLGLIGAWGLGLAWIRFQLARRRRRPSLVSAREGESHPDAQAFR